MKYKLSVALCTCNGGLYIKEQLESIARQILPINEIIICDDKSTDETISIAKIFQSCHQELNIQIYQNEENLGVVKNFEKAISKCSGDIIFLSDQDDIWENFKTKIITEYFDSHKNINLIFTDATIIDKKGELLSQHSLLDAVGLYGKCLKAWNNGMAFEMANQGNRCTGATMAIRKNLINKILPFNKTIKALHDEQLASYCIINNSIAIIKQPLIQYRLHEKNTAGLVHDWFKNPKKSHPYITIFSPVRVNKCFELIQGLNDEQLSKINFLKYRDKYSFSLSGKIKLFFKLHLYIKFYKRYCLYCFIFDLLFGLKYRAKNNMFKAVRRI